MPVYKVTVEFEYYALTSNRERARSLATEAARDVSLPFMALAKPVDPAGMHAIDLEAPVYGPNKDVTVREALQHTAKT